MMEEFDIHTLRQQPEGQQFDRKSFRIDAKSLAVILVAFANADGGDVVIGIEDDGRITGINKGYVTNVNGVDKVSGAAILLFGKDPQKFFQRARIRIVRYDGDEERFGREMNVVKDVSFEGRIVEMTQKAIDFVDTQIKEYSFLGEDARFVTIPQYPLFCWTELIVNAVAHRDYSILGTDILVKIFDHHYVVESPGILPGMVRIDNIRQMHFSRNPKIVQFMQQYKLVKEFGEGVDRMFREMAEAGNPAPEYKQIDFMLKVKLTSAMREEKDAAEKSNMILEKSNMKGEKSSVKNEQLIIETIKANPSAPIPIFQKITGLSRSGIWKILNRLRENGIVRRIGSDRDGYWEIVEKVTQESPPETDGVGIDEKVNEKVNERQRLIISAIINNPHITQSELAKMLEISLVHVNKNMKKLQENGIIRRVGPDKGGHWEVIENGQCTIDNEQ